MMATKAKRWRWTRDGTARRGPVLLETFDYDGSVVWRLFVRVAGLWRRVEGGIDTKTEADARRAAERCADAFVARMLRAFGGAR